MQCERVTFLSRRPPTQRSDNPRSDIHLPAPTHETRRRTHSATLPSVPEFPDIEVYVECLEARIVGTQLEAVRLRSPFLLRTAEPPITECHGKQVLGVRRLGKRIVLQLEDGIFVVLHLMIAGRIRWKKRGAGIPGKIGLAAFDFPHGTLVLTEASSHKRASLHVERGEDALHKHDRGGLEVFDASLDAFTAAICCENHTLKRTLTDPRLLSGIGNAYSDEILHAARLSPIRLSQRLTQDEIARLHECCKDVLLRWRERLRAEVGDNFPDKVTAFHDAMAVHGRYGKPCPDCGDPVQRIVYAKNETNYCATCQTGGKLLADRSMSKLLKKDWPRTLTELDERMGR